MPLQDKPLSEVTDPDDGGEKFAAFALKNSPRIKSTPVPLREFLRKAGDYNRFALNKNRSPIPLYVWAYHIFYAERADGICIRFIRRLSPTIWTNSPATPITCFI